MKINKITFYNYKPFVNKNVLNFNVDKKIAIIMGENGAGKTSVLNGIMWCLYPTPVLEEEIINNDVLYGLETGCKDKMYIELEFFYDEKKYILKRGIDFKKLGEKIYDYDEYKTLNIISKDKDIAEYNVESDIRSIINTVLNEIVKNYFFFDSNKIDEFMKEEHGSEVKKAIKDLLNIETVKRAKDHIQKLEYEQRNKLLSDKSYNEKEVQKNEDLNDLTIKSNKLVESKNDLIESKKTVEKRIQDKMKEIEKNEKNSSYIQEKKDILSKLRNLREESQYKENEIEKVLEDSFLMFGDKLFGDALNILKLKTNSNNNALKEILSGSLLEENCLICDRKLEEDLVKKIRSKILEIKPQDNNNQTFDNISNFTDCIGQGVKNYEDLFRIQKELNIIRDRDDRAQVKLKVIENEIDEDLSDVKDLRALIQALISEKNIINEKINNFEVQIQLNKNNIDILNKELEEILGKKEKSNKDKKMLDVIQSIKSEIDNIYNNYEINQLNVINEKIKGIFNNLTTKKAFSDLFIDLENYNLNIHRNNIEKNIINQISTAERQLLSLSLIMSLAITSEKNGLFVMDNPFTHLDEDHKKKILEQVPLMIDQFIILAPRKEFKNNFLEIIDQNSFTIFELERDLENGITVIKEGNF